jgi:predicted nucleotidyltransferase
MKLRNLLEIRKKFKDVLKLSSVYDVIVFGSYIKGKESPSDVDVAIISDEKFKLDMAGFHISFLKTDDFFKEVSSLVNTLFREGYSLKNKKSFSEIYSFRNRVLFSYSLEGLTASEKVRAVNYLRGKSGEKGLVLERGGEWLSNSVFFCLVQDDYIFEQFFIRSKIKFKKSYVLIH